MTRPGGNLLQSTSDPVPVHITESSYVTTMPAHTALTLLVPPAMSLQSAWPHCSRGWLDSFCPGALELAIFATGTTSQVTTEVSGIACLPTAVVFMLQTAQVWGLLNE